jgi:hypothetical protein
MARDVTMNYIDGHGTDDQKAKGERPERPEQVVKCDCKSQVKNDAYFAHPVHFINNTTSVVSPSRQWQLREDLECIPFG